MVFVEKCVTVLRFIGPLNDRAAPKYHQKYTARFDPTANNIDTRYKSKLMTKHHINNDLVEVCQLNSLKRRSDVREADHAESRSWHRGLRTDKELDYLILFCLGAVYWARLSLHSHTYRAPVIRLFGPCVSGVLTDNLVINIGEYV